MKSSVRCITLQLSSLSLRGAYTPLQRISVPFRSPSIVAEMEFRQRNADPADGIVATRSKNRIEDQDVDVALIFQNDQSLASTFDPLTAILPIFFAHFYKVPPHPSTYYYRIPVSLRSVTEPGPKLVFRTKMLMCPKCSKMTKNDLWGAPHSVLAHAAPP